MATFFERRELRKEVVELPYVADVAIAIFARLARRKLGDVGGAEEDIARGGVIERRQQMQQRAFPGAGLSNDGDHLACCDL
jgi:hypothetical protein